MYVLILLGIIGGSMVPLQSAVNARLSHFTHSVFITSFYSFTVGTTLLLITNLILNPDYFTSRFFSEQSYSYVWFLGGVCGVIFLTSTVILLPRIGAALTVIITVTGQMVIGLLIDTFGWFGAPIQDLDIMHIVGVLFLVAGIVFMNSRRNINVPHRHSRFWLILGLFAGMMPPMQTAINGTLSTQVDSSLFASLISFTVGTLTLLLIALAVNRRLSLQQRSEDSPLRPWHFTGGMMGTLYITMNIILMPALGATLTMMVAIMGQILMGLLIDQFGMFGLPRQKVEQRRIIAVILMAVGVLLVQIF